MPGGGAGARGIALAGRCAKPRKSLIRGAPMAAHVRGPGARRARPDRAARDGARPGRDADPRPGRQPEPADHPPRDLATRFGAQILITNAYILGKSPSRDAIVRVGIHQFLGFPGVVMTDSGAFQSHVYGDVDVTNAEVMAFQKAIHADFGTMLDVFSEPGHDHNRAAKDVDETLRRAQEAVSLRGEMALVGAVQGGLHADLRERCASSVSSLDVAVCAIGGVVPLLEAYRFRDLVRVIIASKKGLDPAKPVHLFGAGHPLVFPLAALLGCDLFDSASYAKYARDGRMLFPDGTRRASEVRESGCLCPVCTTHPMEKIAVEETLLAEHNLHACFGAIREVDQALQVADVHVAVKSVWGPVPLELDHVWPMCQTIVPEALDLEALEAAEVFFREWTAGAGFSFGLLWEGETTLDELRNRAPGARTVDWNTLRIRATADFQFGRGAADALLAGTVSYVISKNTGKIRNVHVNGEHVLSLRAEDGLFTLKVAGARRLSKAFPAPQLRIVVDGDAVPFHREGKNVFAKFVRDADPEIRPGDEALVVSPADELCAVAQSTMNRREMLAFKRGVAAHVREGVPPAPSAPRR